MTNSGDTPKEHDVVEALLRQAVPRQLPPAELERDIREAVEAEWRTVTNRVQARRRVRAFGIAASIALVAFVAFNSLDPGTRPTADVATIDRIEGPVYRLGDDSQMFALDERGVLKVGEIIATRDDGGIGLQWNNRGSLRIDEKTRLEFLAVDRVFLHEGRIYFDSLAARSPGGAAASSLTVETTQGSVTHSGTQFMTEIERNTIRVSVREGVVTVSTSLYDESAHPGQRLEAIGGGRPVITNISRSNPAWQWVEAWAPRIAVDGMSTWDFLHWVGRETGHEVTFADAAAETVARSGYLRGTVNADPRTELRIRMLGEDLHYDMSAGVIAVRRNE